MNTWAPGSSDNADLPESCPLELDELLYLVLVARFLYAAGDVPSALDALAGVAQRASVTRGRLTSELRGSGDLPPEWLSVSVSALALSAGVTRRAVVKAIATGRLKAHDVTKKGERPTWRIDVPEARRFLLERNARLAAQEQARRRRARRAP